MVFIKRNRALITALVGVGIIASTSTPAIASADPQDDPISAEESAEIQAYLNSGYIDWAKMDDMVQEAGGDPIKVSVSGVDSMVSGHEAERILAERELQHQIKSSGADSPIQPFAIPQDAFDLVTGWVGIDQNTVAARGQWNFRDDYIGTGQPDNIAMMAVDGQGCTNLGTVTHGSYRYDGTTTGLTYLRDAGLKTEVAVVGVRDTTSGFGQNADHGFVQVVVNGYCGPVTWRNQFTYEHNQGGGEITGIEAGFGSLGVSYSGGTMSLQKSTQIVED